MRALELLYQYQQTDEVAGGYMSKSLNEAIEELENLQNENNSLVKTLEKYNEEMIELRKQNQDLLNTIITAQEAIENILERNK